MRQTLFYIPEIVFGMPLFGFGLLLTLWLVGLFAIGVINARQHSVANSLTALVPYALFGAAVIVFLMPRLAEPIPGSEPEMAGLPVRGYGVLMFFAVTLAVTLAVYRASKRGIPADYIYGLAVWLFIAGFAGARMFFVYQYRDQFQTNTWSEFLGEVVNIAGGGLVVYGSLIGALLAYAAFTWWHKLPPLVFGDIMAPAILLGLAIGRIGCLMNGCCYGGPCDYPWAIEFPQSSPPYMAQLNTGLSHGFHLTRKGEGDANAGDATGRLQVAMVKPASRAADAGLKAGQVVTAINGKSLTGIAGATAMRIATEEIISTSTGSRLELALDDGSQVAWTGDYAPERSLPTHPAQLYSSLNAFLLCGLILAIAPYQRRDGALLALTLTIYPVTRFLLEIVRQDEAAVNRFGFTISQSVSFGILAVGILLWVFVSRQPREHLQARHLSH